MTIIEFDVQTHTGKVRHHNEDEVFASEQDGLWLVADGMGGHACGEVASTIVVNTMSNSFREGQTLVSSILIAHNEVLEYARINQEAKGMGATVVAMSCSDKQYFIAWVGDSRVYRLRKNRLDLLTRDHSYLEWLKDNGVAIEDAQHHPKRHIITQSVGSTAPPQPDVVSGDFLSGDRYLLCSDGLHDELSDREICTILRSKKSSKDVAIKLINTALENGGRDNVSVIVVDLDPQDRKSLSLWLKLLGSSQLKSIKLPLIIGVLATATIFLLFMAS